MRIFLWQFACIAILAVSAAGVARADEPYTMIRVTCLPQISLFELETFGLYNIDAGNTLGSQAPDGIQTLERFVASAPVSCQTKQGTIQVDVVSYHAPYYRMECGGMEYAELTIKLNGRDIDAVPSTHGGCGDSDYKNLNHQIRVTQYQLTHCRSEFNEFEQSIPGRLIFPALATIPTVCNTVPLPQR